MREFRLTAFFFRAGLLFLLAASASSQNIFSGERVQIVGQFNGYATAPYNADYRTTTYRKMTTASGTPVDGRGQWVTTINVQNSGGDVTPVNMPGGGGNGFLFISGPSANRFLNKWVFSGIGQGALNSFNSISCFNCGNDMGLDMSVPGYYTFVFNDCGYTQTNCRYYVGRTTSPPVSVVRSSQSISLGNVTVNIATGNVPSPEEKIYVRYTLGPDFSGSGTSTILQAAGSGTSYSATIPAQAAGTTIRYFVFSSTLTLAQLSLGDLAAFAPAATESEKNSGVLRFDDNGGSNFVVLAPSASSVAVSGRITDSEGRPVGRAKVVLAAVDGTTKLALSNQFGVYRIENVEAGQTYFCGVTRKGLEFTPRTLWVNEDLRDFDFVAAPQ